MFKDHISGAMDLIWKSALLPYATTLLTGIVGVILGDLLPKSMTFGRRCANLEGLLLQALVASGAARLRAAFQCRSGRVPRWARRVSQVLPPKWLAAVCGTDFQLVLKVWRDMCTTTEQAGGVVDALWTHAGFYIGKAKWVRATGCNGLASRLGEHVRALLRPELRRDDDRDIDF